MNLLQSYTYTSFNSKVLDKLYKENIIYINEIQEKNCNEIFKLWEKDNIILLSYKLHSNISNILVNLCKDLIIKYEIDIKDIYIYTIKSLLSNYINKVPCFLKNCIKNIEEIKIKKFNRNSILIFQNIEIENYINFIWQDNILNNKIIITGLLNQDIVNEKVNLEGIIEYNLEINKNYYEIKDFNINKDYISIKHFLEKIKNNKPIEGHKIHILRYGYNKKEYNKILSYSNDIEIIEFICKEQLEETKINKKPILFILKSKKPFIKEISPSFKNNIGNIYDKSSKKPTVISSMIGYYTKIPNFETFYIK
jgi:hypothetical protein